MLAGSQSEMALIRLHATTRAKSVPGQYRPSQVRNATSETARSTDIIWSARLVRFVPTADIASNRLI